MESAPNATPDRKPSVVLTLGKFDGVHAGHRHLAATVIDAASRARCASAVLVLHPHPASVLAGLRIPVLTTIQERRRRLRALGIDIVEPLHFTPEIAALSPDDFVNRLCQRFRIAKLIIGPDFAFGKGRSGDLASLRAIGAQRGFDVAAVEPLSPGVEHLSSKLVRRMIEEGEVESARSAMREPVLLQGTVIHGAARGRELGFPTANLDLGENFCIPGNGIYAVQATWRDMVPNNVERAHVGGAHRETWVDGLASIGVRPTFDNGPRSVEVFLLDFSGDLYGKTLKVRFLARQRGEEKFESVEELVAQMHRDVEVGTRILAAERSPAWQVVEGPAGPIAHVRGFDLAALFENTLACLPALRRGYGVAGLGALPAKLPDQFLERLFRLEHAKGEYEADEGLAALLQALPGSLVGGSIHCATPSRIEGLLQLTADPADALSATTMSVEVLEGPSHIAQGGLRVSIGLTAPA